MKALVILVGFLFVVSFLLTYLVRFFALKHKVIDIPNERSSHSVPIPRGGGLAIVITWFVGVTILFSFGYIGSQLFYALLSGIILAMVSFLDDIFDLKPIIRLLSQLLTATLALYFLNGIDSIHFYNFEFNIEFLLFPIAVIGIVWFINLFNFLDGIDGYASIETISIALMIFFFTLDPILLILVGCVLGFLIWNWPKAKIFMGDVGSTQLGFILIILGIFYHNENKLTIMQWIMISSPFWFDATITLYRRWRNKEKLSQAHRKHVYQRVVQSGFSHLRTDISLVLINTLVFVLVFFSNKYESLLLPCFIVIVIFLYIITKLVDKRVPF